MNRRNFILSSLSISSSLYANTYTSLLPTIKRTKSIAVSEKVTYFNAAELSTLKSIHLKLKRCIRHFGYGNFNFLSFETLIKNSKENSKIGAFSKSELTMLDQIYYDDPKKYGFFGMKTSYSITTKIDPKSIEKIKGTGHYLFKGKPLENYNKLLQDVPGKIILTSGVRGVPKQMYLYITKILQLKGNITKASSIIAPPAYTYHALGDFDVGKKGFGIANFSDKFTTTDEFKALIKLDYISMRYKKNNKDGVQYEPWHIEII